MREVSGWQSAAPATSPVFSGWIKPDRGRGGTSEKHGGTLGGTFLPPSSLPTRNRVLQTAAPTLPYFSQGFAGRGPVGQLSILRACLGKASRGGQDEAFQRDDDSQELFTGYLRSLNASNASSGVS